MKRDKFNPKVFSGKRIFRKIPGEPKIERIWIWDENSNKYDSPKFGKRYRAVRYEKTLEKNFKVSVDVLIGEVMDRETKSKFLADWVFENSSLRYDNASSNPALVLFSISSYIGLSN